MSAYGERRITKRYESYNQIMATFEIILYLLVHFHHR